MELKGFDQNDFAKSLFSLDKQAATQHEMPTQPEQVQPELVVLEPNQLHAMLQEVALSAVQAIRSTGIDSQARLVDGIRAGMASVQSSEQARPVIVAAAQRSVLRKAFTSILFFGGLGAGAVLATQSDISDRINQPITNLNANQSDIVDIPIGSQNNNIKVVKQGSAPILEQQSDGTFVAGVAKMAWQLLTVSPDGSSYSIELSLPSPAGGFQPDASLQERLRPDDISNEELVRYLLANGVIAPNSASGTYIEIVGKRSKQDGSNTRVVLKTITLGA